MPPIPEPVLAVVPQVLAAGSAVLGLAWLRRQQPAGTPPTIGWEGAAIALGLAGAVFLLRGWHGLPPADVNDWPLALIVPAGLLTLSARAAWRWFIPLAAIFVAVALPLVLRISLRDWTPGTAALWLPALGLPWLALILAARTTAERLPGAALPAWGAALGVTGYLLADPAASLINGFLVAGAGAAAGTLAIGRLRWGERIHPTSAVVALAAVAPLWWLLTHSLSCDRDGAAILPAQALIPLALAPLGAWAAWPLRTRPWTAAIIAAAVAAGVAAGALLLVRTPPPTTLTW